MAQPVRLVQMVLRASADLQAQLVQLAQLVSLVQPDLTVFLALREQPDPLGRPDPEGLSVLPVLKV